MKRSLTPVLWVGLATMAGCGSASDQGSDTKSLALIHKIQPLGVNTSCMGSGARQIRDHRVNPPLNYTQYFVQMKGCSAPESSLQVNMLGGQQWVGGYSYVTIKKNGLCLHNPVSYVAGGTDKGETFWQSCVAQNSSSPERFRQQFILLFNRNNVLQIQTPAAVSLGLPNAQVQCLDRQTPTEIKRVPCGLHNWQIVRG